MSSCSTTSGSISSPSRMRPSPSFRPMFHDVNLQVLVNLTMLLPHNRQQNLLNVDPELKAYPVLLIKQPRDMYLRIKDIKTHICDILKETLSIIIGTKEFRLTFDVDKAGEMYRHHQSEDTSIYKALLQCEFRENPKVSFGQLFGSQHRFDVLCCRSSRRLFLLVVTCNCRVHDSKQGYMACAQATRCMGTCRSSDMHEKQELMRVGTRQKKTEPLHSWDCAILGSCRHVARNIYICT